MVGPCADGAWYGFNPEFEYCNLPGVQLWLHWRNGIAHICTEPTCCKD